MNLAQLQAFLFAQPLLALTVAAILLASVGWMIHTRSPRVGTVLRLTGYGGMVAAVLLTVVEAAWEASRSDVNLATGRVGKVAVIGRETVVPLDSSGHYWIKAELEGKPVEFLVDTGATYTTLSPQTARDTGTTADPGQLPITLTAANGPITARFAKARELSFGSVTVKNLTVVIGPETGDDTNVIGMNLLSRLKSWRVDQGKLVMVPGNAP
ncbi:MAG: TIGR02281 family clan AA aspartic protease [Sphingomonadales bacterium]|nr:TIGR02281 family clan AA aspartic protease [Sphingomonadales bacterium]